MILKYCGIALLLFGALSLSRDYTRYCARRLEVCRAFLFFIKHIRAKVGRYLSPRSQWCSDFQDKTLEELGFLPAVRGGKSLLEAKDTHLRGSLLPSDASEALSALFSELGRGYLDEELRSLDGAISALGEICERESLESTRSARIAKTLILGAALGITVLLL